MADSKELQQFQAFSQLGTAPSMYTFGGGSIGDVWDWRKPTEVETTFGMYKQGEMIPVLKKEYEGKVNVVGSGMAGRQENRGMLGAGGRPWVEAPQRYEAIGGGAFKNPVTGQTFSGPSTWFQTAREKQTHGAGLVKNTSQRSWSNYSGKKYSQQGNPTYSAEREAETKRRFERSWKTGFNPTAFAAPEERKAFDAYQSRINQPSVGSFSTINNMPTPSSDGPFSMSPMGSINNIPNYSFGQWPSFGL